MARISGIQIEKDHRGRPAYIRISIKKHGEKLRPFLEEIGVVEEDEFDRDWKDAISGEELVERLKPRIKKLFDA
jgi:hypothetical protein